MSEIDVFEPYGPTIFISLRIALMKIEIYADVSVFIWLFVNQTVRGQLASLWLTS